MEELILGIINRVRTSTAVALKGPYTEWRVSVGEHNGAWLAYLLSYDVMTGTYRLVREGNLGSTCVKALASLDRLVEMLVYVEETKQAGVRASLPHARSASEKAQD